MGTIFNYIEQYQEDSFEKTSINEIDFVILNELVYLPFDHYLTSEYTIKSPMSLKELYVHYWVDHRKHHLDNPILATENRHKLFTAVVGAKRYDNISISTFIHHYDAGIDKQFCAATFTLADNSHILVYRGTDDTLVGWKEDFMLAYQECIPAQLDAEKYLNKLLPYLNNDLYLTGHSKGGNLALFAALQIHKNNPNLIDGIYLFDSPGLTESFIHSADYQDLKSKVHLYIPEDSVVGRMMYHDIQPQIVKSNLISLFQHSIMNWKVVNNTFELVEKTTNNSNLIDVTLKDWTHHYTSEDLAFFFEYAFDLLKQSNIITLNDISRDFIGFIKNMYTHTNKIAKEDREKFDVMWKQLLDTWNLHRQELWQNQWKAIEKQVTQIFEINPIQAISDWLDNK